MAESCRYTPRELGALINSYLGTHLEVDGIRGIADRTGLSYHSVQKYLRGLARPPAEKWEPLRRLIENHPESPQEGQSALFSTAKDAGPPSAARPDDGNDRELDTP